jgi:hypothetical protein
MNDASWRLATAGNPYNLAEDSRLGRAGDCGDQFVAAGSETQHDSSAETGGDFWFAGD